MSLCRLSLTDRLTSKTPLNRVDFRYYFVVVWSASKAIGCTVCFVGKGQGHWSIEEKNPNNNGKFFPTTFIDILPHHPKHARAQMGSVELYPVASKHLFPDHGYTPYLQLLRPTRRVYLPPAGQWPAPHYQQA